MHLVTQTARSTCNCASRLAHGAGRFIQSVPSALAQRDAAGRSVWLLLGLAHLPVWLKSAGLLGDSFDPLRFILLTLSLVFLALKAADWRVLRFSQHRGAWIVLTLCVALLHADVVSRTLGVRLDAAEPTVQTVSLLASLSGLAGALALTHVLRLLSHGERRLQALLSNLLGAVRLAHLPPRNLLLVRAGPTYRAPPCCNA